MTQHNSSAITPPSRRLFERGQVYLQSKHRSTEVTRGMVVLTQEGWESGQVAAVVEENSGQQVTHLLLVRSHLVSDYRLVPVNLIEEVGEEMVLLGINREAIESLPRRQSEA